MNCTVVNTAASGVIPDLRVSINCIATGAVINTPNRWYYTLGAATNYSSGVTSLYCKYGQTVAFKNPSQNDYRLSWSDTAAKYQGIYTGAYSEDVVDVELRPRLIRTAYGADEPCVDYYETLYGLDVSWKIKGLILDSLRGLDNLNNRAVLETLYCVAEDIYRGALSGRILIKVQKKTSRIYRI
jgi:hypothetical protein